MNNLKLMQKRLEYNGGELQQKRMIQDKYKSLQKALIYSYQAGEVKKENDKEIYKALINPNKLKPDYDDKIISINFDSQFKIGDVFEWVGTKTHWIIYSQELTELAYFRGDIRKCSFEISWEDEGQKKSTFAAIRGPVETDINSISKHDLSIDVPNHSLHLLMPKNKDTLKYFKRYSKFYLNNINENVNFNSDICWRIEALDSISSPGILELTAEEYFSNKDEDSEGIVGNKIEPPSVENSTELIIGKIFIKPRVSEEYSFVGEKIEEWNLKDQKVPVQLIKNGKKVSVKWNANYSGQFNLYYGDTAKTIVVESLF